MKIISECCVCGKKEKIPEAWANDDGYGVYHICNECLGVHKKAKQKEGESE